MSLRTPPALAPLATAQFAATATEPTATAADGFPAIQDTNAHTRNNEQQQHETQQECGNDSIHLAPKIIQQNILPPYPKIVQQFEYRGIHHWRATQVILTIFWCLMVFQVLLVQDTVYKSGQA